MWKRPSFGQVYIRVIDLTTSVVAYLKHVQWNWVLFSTTFWIRAYRAQHVTKVWKDAVVVPDPKSSCHKSPKDVRPVTLTSILMNIFEKIVRSDILWTTEQALDHMQFAYHTVVEDAIVTLFKQLEGNGSHVKLQFVDLFSASKTIQPHILTSWLLEQFDGFLTF